jgi:hypothetical protein
MGQSSGSNCHADTYSSESADGRGPCPAPPLVLTTCLDDLANSSMSWALAAGSPSTETADFTSWWRCRHCDSGHASRSPFAATPRPAGNPGVGNALAGQQHDPRSLRRAARTLARRRHLEILPMPCHGIACGANTDSKRDFGSGRTHRVHPRRRSRAVRAHVPARPRNSWPCRAHVGPTLATCAGYIALIRRGGRGLNPTPASRREPGPVVRGRLGRSAGPGSVSGKP